MKINELFDLDKTIASEVFEGCEYPWQVLSKIKEFTLALGKKLDKEKFDEISPDVWVSKSAKVAPTAFIAPPCIIDEGAEVRHCAFIRGGVIVGKNSVVGNSTEMKNAIIFDNVQIPHFNYVGDSILGYKSHLGAGAVTSNVKSDKTLVTIKNGDEKIETGLKKFGAMVGDFTEVGCNSVLCPGSVIGRNCTVYPLSRVRGYLKENSIFKAEGNIVTKK
jgi:NDP-sugar pyrophosphorylase family protein